MRKYEEASVVSAVERDCPLKKLGWILNPIVDLSHSPAEHQQTSGILQSYLNSDEGIRMLSDTF